MHVIILTIDLLTGQHLRIGKNPSRCGGVRCAPWGADDVGEGESPMMSRKEKRIQRYCTLITSRKILIYAEILWQHAFVEEHVICQGKVIKRRPSA